MTMKKHLISGLLIFFISACSPFWGGATATPTPEPSPFPTATLPPTPIPASQTPEPTLTPEPTSTPLLQYFTAKLDSSLAGWVILQAGNNAAPNISSENSALRIQMVSPYTFLYALYSPFDYTDVNLQTEFTNSASTPASTGLICRYSEKDGWLEYNVSSDGTYNVLYGRWLDTGIADYLPVVNGSSKEIKQSGETQQIGMTCSGTTAQLYVNGILIRNVDVSRFELVEGKVGLTASSYENTPVVVTIDSVTVSQP
jgi:hypothetical protein